MSLSLGLGFSETFFGSSIGGGVGPPPYTTGAVSLDGATSLLNAALACVDTDYYFLSFWAYLLAYPAQNNIMSVFVSDPANYYDNFDFGNPTGGSTQYTWSAGAGNSITNSFVGANEIPDASFPGAWHNVILAADLSTNTPHNLVYYRDGVQHGSVVNTGGNAAAILLNGLRFIIGGDGTNGNQLVAYLADLVFGTTNIFTGSGLSAGTIGHFISGGKPTNMASIISTYNPAIALRRAPSAAASTFATNLGTGGNFTIGRTLSTTGSNGPGPVTLTGAVIGNAVYDVFDSTSNAYVASDFESTISVANQIQQTGATDYSADTINVFMAGGAGLTDAPSSPSD